jgi:hypothetical protein
MVDFDPSQGWYQAPTSIISFVSRIGGLGEPDLLSCHRGGEKGINIEVLPPCEFFIQERALKQDSDSHSLQSRARRCGDEA